MLVIDLKLPLMDGLEFLSWKRNSPHQEVPVVVLTGSEDPGKKELALNLGAAMFLPKPISLAVLTKFVIAICETLIEKRISVAQ